VYTFDVNEEFMKIAEKNIKKAGMSRNFVLSYSRSINCFR